MPCTRTVNPLQLALDLLAMSVTLLHTMPTCLGCRAASIDRGIFLEAAAVGLRTREVPGTRKQVPGGLEGAVYEVRWAHLAKGPFDVEGKRSAGSGVTASSRQAVLPHTALIAAATLGPLAAGLAMAYFLSAK